jgi:hypothetical protein
MWEGSSTMSVALGAGPHDGFDMASELGLHHDGEPDERKGDFFEDLARKMEKRVGDKVDGQALVGRIMLARMKAMEEGFAELLRMVQVGVKGSNVGGDAVRPKAEGN